MAVVATGASDVTLLIRGRQPFFNGAISPFLRIQVKISTTIDPDDPIVILEWQTVLGDLRIEKAGVFQAALGFGWDDPHRLLRPHARADQARPAVE